MKPIPPGACAPSSNNRRATMRLVALFSFWWLLTVCLSAQDSTSHRLDSLAQRARTQPPDTSAVIACSDLCYEYRFINQDTALTFGRRGIELGKRLKFDRGLAQVYSDVAFVHYDRAEFDSARFYWQSALALRTALGDKPGMASLQLKLGAVYFRQGRYDDALRYQLDALRAYEALNIPQWAGQAMNNVAAVYEHQKHFDKALEYYEKALALHRQHNNTPQVGTALINIGNIHFHRKDYGPARQYYLQAIGLLREDTDPSGQAIALNNLSEIHTVEARYDSAAWYSDKALTLRRKVGDVAGIISSMNMLGRIQTKLKNYTAAESYLNEALALATEKEILYEKGRIYQNLYELFRDKGDWRKSLDAHVQYAAIRDSLLNEEGRKTVAALQVQYETDKKEQQIVLQYAELSEKQVRIERDAIIIVALSITTVLAVIIFILLRNRQRKKADLQRKVNEIALREAYIRATIESQENERKRFARDLHDGMGQWISSLRLALAEIQAARSDAHKLEILDRADGIMNDIHAEFRSVAFNLMPHTLIHYGLKAALEEMAGRLNTTNKCVFSVTAFGFPERLPELSEIALYRVVQEWTNNILKHSDATVVGVQLTGHDDELIILIEDNGRGIDPHTLMSGKGNGWKNIRSRMNLIKGTVDIDSSPGRAGTTITLIVPKADMVHIESPSVQDVNLH